MLNRVPVSIARLVKLTHNILYKVDDSKDIESATVVPDSNQVNTKVEPLDNQPTFLYSKESLVQLKKIYPVVLWDKNKTSNDLAFNAGQQDIINFIERRLGKESLKVLK